MFATIYVLSWSPWTSTALFPLVTSTNFHDMEVSSSWPGGDGNGTNNISRAVEVEVEGIIISPFFFKCEKDVFYMVPLYMLWHLLTPTAHATLRDKSGQHKRRTSLGVVDMAMLIWNSTLHNVVAQWRESILCAFFSYLSSDLHST